MAKADMTCSPIVRLGAGTAISRLVCAVQGARDTEPDPRCAAAQCQESAYAQVCVWDVRQSRKSAGAAGSTQSLTAVPGPGLPGTGTSSLPGAPSGHVSARPTSCHLMPPPIWAGIR